MTKTCERALKGGVVAAGAPVAAEAGAEMLRLGGNAADAAVAAALATCVADPANASLLGRCQILLRTAGGAFVAIDGASAIPSRLPSEIGDGPLAWAAIPGLPQALEQLHAAHGRLPLAVVAAPAARLAEEGFVPPAHLGAVWALRANALAAGDAGPYVEHGHPPARFRHRRLAALLRSFGANGAQAITTGETARQLAAGIRARGGHWQLEDLAANQARDGEVIHGTFRDYRITTIGRHGWGHSLIEMLAILDRLPAFGPELTGAEACRLTEVIRTCFADRPQQLGTLVPKPAGLALETLVAPDFVAARARAIARRCAVMSPLASATDRNAHAAVDEDQDTTHLSTLDAEGACVALTISIGPHFGLRSVDPNIGLLPAKSYRMARAPLPGARDVTEMSPAIVTRGGRIVLSLGAAGSERIPGAVMQVIVNVIDRGLDLAEAVRLPRVNLKGEIPRVHSDAGAEVLAMLWARWPDLQVCARGHENHLGIVHAVGQDGDGEPAAAADDAWDGKCAFFSKVDRK